MDNLTHSLTGLALARAGLERFSPRAASLLILSANAPDLDIVFLAQGPLKYFEAHRGYSHSVLFLPMMALLAVLVTSAIFRQRLPWLKAWLICCIGVASHLLIDWTNNYGIRLLLPFSSRWFHLDLNSLYDAWILLALLFAAGWPVFSSLVSGEIGARRQAGRGLAIFALAFFLFFDCGRALLHSRAVAQLDARLYDDAPPIQTAAFPDPFSPLRWSGVVETQTAYLTTPVESSGDLGSGQERKYFKPAVTPALELVANRPEFRYLRYFSRFPVWSVEPVALQDGEGTRLELSDLRFGSPGVGAFHCVALVDSHNQVLGSWFTYGSGREYGWSATADGGAKTH